MNKVIGFTGLAGCGKDSLFTILSEITNGNVVRFALADALKQELREHVQKLYNIDIFNCSREDKELIRPIMVDHGKIKRKQTQGRYWTELLQKSISAYPESGKVAIITDIRYIEYPKDEFFWLKQELNGLLVHISKYVVNPQTGGKVFSLPPNREEAINDPLLAKKADHRIFIEDCKGDLSLLRERAYPILQEFAKTYGII